MADPVVFGRLRKKECLKSIYYCFMARGSITIRNPRYPDIAKYRSVYHHRLSTTYKPNTYAPHAINNATTRITSNKYVTPVNLHFMHILDIHP